MKSLLLKFSVIMLLLPSLPAMAAQDEPVDTVFFYGSWEQMLDAEPDTMITAPMIDVYSPFELYFETLDKKANKRIKKDYIAATLGDSTWLINSNYLRKNFKGDSKKLHGYVPLFFNDKVAYAVAEECAYAEIADVGFNVISNYHYYIDFKQRKVLRIDSNRMCELLADYPDLRMRYESMQSYKSYSIINDFLLQYIDRVTDDFMRPYILDLVQ